MIEAIAIAVAVGFVLGLVVMSWISGSPWKREGDRRTIERIGVEFHHYHRWLGEFPAVCRVLENLHVDITTRPLVPYQDHWRDVSRLREELRAASPPLAAPTSQHDQTGASGGCGVCVDAASKGGNGNG